MVWACGLSPDRRGSVKYGLGTVVTIITFAGRVSHYLCLKD